jgi:hypothetical protein
MLALLAFPVALAGQAPPSPRRSSLHPAVGAEVG